jgi:hypothetical protein
MNVPTPAYVKARGKRVQYFVAGFVSALLLVLAAYWSYHLQSLSTSHEALRAAAELPSCDTPLCANSGTNVSSGVQSWTVWCRNLDGSVSFVNLDRNGNELPQEIP